MAQYKVPQDVEADDKLLGPFSFRQFLYLLIAAGFIALAVVLFKIFPLLALIPLPPALLLIVLALPLRKDQPMETYLAAIVSYYTKPHTRFWTPGQRESTIQITAPKIVESDQRSKNITGEEATHRLSFLADIVDSGGRAVQNSNIRDDIAAEADATPDIFEDHHFETLDSTIIKGEENHHQEVIQEMRDAIDREEQITFNSPTIILPDSAPEKQPVAQNAAPTITVSPPPSPKPPQHSIIELTNNPDYSISTIAKEAKRIKGKEDGEIFISLH